MKKRILSDRQRRWLQGELADWREQGIVSPEQSDHILTRYESADEVSHRKRSRFTFTIIGLAGLLFGAAALLLMGYNWDAIPRVAKTRSNSSLLRAGKVAIIKGFPNLSTPVRAESRNGMQPGWIYP